MPEAASGEAAFLNGQEIVNDARTLAYLANGYGPPNLNIDGGCSCPTIRELIECSSNPYSSPASDPAPWYDSSVPESADFAGFLVVDFEGLGSTYSRTSIDKVTGGSVLGRLRPGPRTMIWRGFLFGRSDCAVRYGLSWMTANLVGANCDCNGEELDLLVCCPDLLPALEDEEDDCGRPPVNRPEVCPPFSQPDAFRQLKNVALIDGPKILSQRKIADTIIIEIEFSLMAGNPYLYGCPVCLCAEQSFPVLTEEDCIDVWHKITDIDLAEIELLKAMGGQSFCLGDVCEEIKDCTEQDTACSPADLPNLVPFVDGCFCDPIMPVQFCCTVPANSFGQFFDGAPVIEIYSGSSVMRSTTIRFFSNPQGLECCDVAEDPCLNCDSLQIRYIPAFSTMTIDGTTRSVTVLCPGQSTPIRAEHLTVTPFAWPILQCIDYCICIETDGAVVAEDATVTVSITPREM